MLNSALITLFCGHYRGREKAFVERVKSGWIDDLPNWKDELCFENFSLSLIFLCKLSGPDHENMAVVEAWPLVEIRLYFFCASREGASQHGRRKHSSLKEQVRRGSGKNCIVEGWISCALIRPGKEDEEMLCWCAAFKSLFYLFIYLFIYLYSEVTQALRAVKPFQVPMQSFSFFLFPNRPFLGCSGNAREKFQTLLSRVQFAHPPTPGRFGFDVIWTEKNPVNGWCSCSLHLTNIVVELGGTSQIVAR